MRWGRWLAEGALSKGSETGTLSWAQRELSLLSATPHPGPPQGKPESGEVKGPYGTHTSLPSPQGTVCAEMALPQVTNTTTANTGTTTIALALSPWG